MSSPEYAETEAKLRAVYTQHMPSKLGTIPAILQQFAGREAELLSRVEKKYVLGQRRTPSSRLPEGAVTSDSHPIRVSWVSAAAPGRGRVGLCFCPGKRIQKSRLRAGHEESGTAIMRDLPTDLRRLREHFGAQMLICLLNAAELRSLGIRCDYGKAVEKAGLAFVHYVSSPPARQGPCT